MSYRGVEIETTVGCHPSMKIMSQRVNGSKKGNLFRGGTLDKGLDVLRINVAKGQTNEL